MQNSLTKGQLLLSELLCLLLLKNNQPQIILLPNKYISGWQILLPFIRVLLLSFSWLDHISGDLFEPMKGKTLWSLYLCDNLLWGIFLESLSSASLLGSLPLLCVLRHTSLNLVSAGQNGGGAFVHFSCYLLAGILWGWTFSLLYMLFIYPFIHSFINLFVSIVVDLCILSSFSGLWFTVILYFDAVCPWFVQWEPLHTPIYFNISLLNFEHFVTSWQNNIFQAHSALSLPRALVLCRDEWCLKPRCELYVEWLH